MLETKHSAAADPGQPFHKADVLPDDGTIDLAAAERDGDMIDRHENRAQRLYCFLEPQHRHRRSDKASAANSCEHRFCRRRAVDAKALQIAQPLVAARKDHGEATVQFLLRLLGRIEQHRPSVLDGEANAIGVHVNPDGDLTSQQRFAGPPMSIEQPRLAERDQISDDPPPLWRLLPVPACRVYRFERFDDQRLLLLLSVVTIRARSVCDRAVYFILDVWQPGQVARPGILPKYLARQGCAQAALANERTDILRALREFSPFVFLRCKPIVRWGDAVHSKPP